MSIYHLVTRSGRKVAVRAESLSVARLIVSKLS
jgi:hypothetical protein